jgi:hypothetical protein
MDGSSKDFKCHLNSNNPNTGWEMKKRRRLALTNTIKIYGNTHVCPPPVTLAVCPCYFVQLYSTEAGGRNQQTQLDLVSAPMQANKKIERGRRRRNKREE